jgi:hypothetical protein
MENPYVGLPKRDLQSVELRLLNELSNLRVDSRRAKQKLELTRSCMAKVKFELDQLDRAVQLSKIVQFPSPTTIEIVPEKSLEITAKKIVQK